MSGFLQAVAAHWVLIFFLTFLFGGSVLAFLNEVYSGGIRSLRRRARLRRQHQLKLRKLELQIARAHAKDQPALAAPKKPGRCVHSRVTPVVSDDEVVAWLCKNESCGKQLPKDWAVREEDL